MTAPHPYPTGPELAAVNAAEKLMRDAMAHNDPSHDPLHGPCCGYSGTR